ncbi:hypothetical protein QVD99_003616 [Batrachochytrium dendrobatidis]|nr:hypothetical protein O5D80_003924 [Batrachochytrium dendrobatidis]KAK5669206.1 hypothetical protein QVD99_003616 [Batrachochytrium dendrobatidis]
MQYYISHSQLSIRKFKLLSTSDSPSITNTTVHNLLFILRGFHSIESMSLYRLSKPILAVVILLALIYASTKNETCPAIMTVLLSHWVVLVVSSNLDAYRLHTTGTTQDSLMEQICFLGVFISIIAISVDGLVCPHTPVLLEILFMDFLIILLFWALFACSHVGELIDMISRFRQRGVLTAGRQQELQQLEGQRMHRSSRQDQLEHHPGALPASKDMIRQIDIVRYCSLSKNESSKDTLEDISVDIHKPVESISPSVDTDICKVNQSNSHIPKAKGTHGITQNKTNVPIKELYISNEDAHCAICIDDYKDGDQLHHLPCGHHLHFVCSKKWLKQRSRCPLCNCCINKSVNCHITVNTLIQPNTDESSFDDIAAHPNETSRSSTMTSSRHVSIVMIDSTTETNR